MRKMKKILEKATPFEHILAHYIDPGYPELKDTTMQIKERWETAFGLLRNYRSREQTAKIIMSQFGISRSQAYVDINSAISLFGDINKSRKEGMRYLISEYNTLLLQKAVEANDMDQMGKAIDRMMRIEGLDKEDAAFNPEKLENVVINLNIPEKVQSAMLKMIHKGSVDLNNFNTIEIPHQDLEKDA